MPVSPLTTASTLQLHEIPDKLSSLEVPELHRPIIAAGHHKVVCELETGDSTEVLVGALECVDTLASGDVPDL